MERRLRPVCLIAAALLMCISLAWSQEAEKPLVTIGPDKLELPKNAEVTAKLLADGSAVSLTSAGVKEAAVLNVGWIPIQPNTGYRARYRLKPVALQEPANVYLMLREHEAKDVRPIQPYQRESVRIRQVKPDPNGAWVERELRFVTGDKTTFLSGSIVVVALNGELQVGAFELFAGAETPPAPPVDPAQAWADYEKMMAEVRAQADTRAPLTPRSLVFSRSQMKYGLGRNYLHQWNDRPLLVSRDYRQTSDLIAPASSYQRTLETVVKYDIDGLAFFPETRNRMAIFDMHEQFNIPGVGLLPEFLTAYTEDHIKLKGDILERALKTPFAPRINGKLLITSYGAQGFKPAEWKEILDQLRARVGDSFIFLPSLTNVVALRAPLLNGEPVSRAALEQEKQFLREYLDVCDGIYFNYPPALRNKDHSFDAKFYREVFIPVFKSVLAEPAYRNKYLGLSAYRSHMASDRGNNLHEDYTRTLRSSFEAAMDARPDVIILPEWDEQNENTSFRPTAYGGTTSERLLRYYMSRIKSKPPTPVPGDDTTIPNLLLTTRKIITLGEPVIVELVNVPDETASNSYQAEVVLQDEAGRVVHKFAPVTFDSAKLQEERLSVPSETLADSRVLVPVLTVRGYKGHDLNFDSGLHHIQVRATWNWDYLAVRQPLRDLLRPTEVKLTWQATAGGNAPLTLTGTVSGPQDLGLVEVLGDDDEVYAVDTKKEFYRDDPSVERFLIEYRSLNTVPVQGAVTLKNALSPVWLAMDTVCAPVETKEPKSQRIELQTDISEHVRWLYFAVPRADLDKAVLDWNFDKASFSVPLREVLDKQIIARDFEGPINITVQPYRRQIDIPFHLTQRQVSFQVPVWPEIATEVYHLRVTTADGKVFRSRPLLVPGAGSTAKVPLRIYSEAKKGPMDVPVAASRIPVIKYEFDPSRGAVLIGGNDRPFWASLGGFTSATTGRGSPNGLFRSSRGAYPARATHSAPVWVAEDGRPCLEFDGVGTYLELPRESLPCRGAYTLSFDVKPATDKDQFLLITRVGGSQKGLGLQIRGGKLVVSHAGANWGMQSFETGLELPAGQWSTIRLSHDFEQMKVSVNGQSAVFEVTLPANNLGYTLIGEGWTGNWFEGRLRNLQITQNRQ